MSPAVPHGGRHPAGLRGDPKGRTTSSQPHPWGREGELTPPGKPEPEEGKKSPSCAPLPSLPPCPPPPPPLLPRLGHDPGHSAHGDNSQQMRSTSPFIKFSLLGQNKRTRGWTIHENPSFTAGDTPVTQLPHPVLGRARCSRLCGVRPCGFPAFWSLLSRLSPKI